MEKREKFESLRNLKWRLSELTRQDYYIDYEYEVGNFYEIEYSHGIISVTMKRSNAQNELFYKMLREVNSSVETRHSTDELGVQNSREWLFHHYLYGYTNNANCILIGASGDILGISYNGMGRTDFIYAYKAISDGYIIINNKKKIKNDNYQKEKILAICRNLKNNNII